MKFLKKLILSEKLNHINKDIHISEIDYSKVPVISKEIEDFIINNADINDLKSMQLLQNYTIDKVTNRIQNDPHWRDPEKRVWKEGEKKLALSPSTAIDYAIKVIYKQIEEDLDRWKEADKNILKSDHETIIRYIRTTKKNNWKEGEKVIANSAYFSFRYAAEVIKGEIQKDPDRWKEGEKIIATDPKYSYLYAREIISEQIENDPHWRDPEKRRWREGEKILSQSKRDGYLYATYLISDQTKQDPNRWKEGEKNIAANNTIYEIYYYMVNVIKDQLIADPNRWEDGKNRIKSDPKHSVEYAKLTNRPFPEAEQYILKSSHYIDYKEFIKKNWDSFTEEQKKGVHPEFLTK
jgi:hypothetical protein